LYADFQFVAWMQQRKIQGVFGIISRITFHFIRATSLINTE